MKNVKAYIESLGYRAKDKVTGFTGVISSISFYLYGCIQAIIAPGIDKDGKIMDSLISISEGRKGPAEKPKATRV